MKKFYSKILPKRGRGRPATGQGEMVYIPQKLIPIVEKLKAGEIETVIALIQDLK